MTNPREDLLTTTEGVDEGSATSTVEGGPSTRVVDAVRGERADGPDDVEAAPAPPVDTESGESRAARDAGGTGQQLEAGEG